MVPKNLKKKRRIDKLIIAAILIIFSLGLIEIRPDLYIYPLQSHSFVGELAFKIARVNTFAFFMIWAVAYIILNKKTISKKRGESLLNKKYLKTILAIALAMTVGVTNVYAAEYNTTDGTQRLAGASRYETAKVIAENYNNSTVNSVILASGTNFPDALAASTLVYKLQAPLLLVSQNDASVAIDYISSHMPTTGRVYIVGGAGVISANVEATLKRAGYTNIIRLAGENRYKTNMEIIRELKGSDGAALLGRPVFIASATNFPDALAASSFAGGKGYPILLAGSELTQDALGYLSENKSSKAYILGGNGAVSSRVESQLETLGIPFARLSGNSRYETNSAIANEFADQPSVIYLANGANFPDALAGGVLASKIHAPILLVDNTKTTLPAITESYLKQYANKSVRVRALGGTGAVSDALLKNAENILDGIAVVDPNDPLKGWVCPEIKSVAGSDPKKNIQTLVDELQLTPDATGQGNGASFNLAGQGVYNVTAVAFYFQNTGHVYPEEDVDFTIRKWDGYDSFPETYRTKPMIEQAFKFYLPTGYKQLMSILDSITDENYNKKFTMDNREVRVMYGGGTIIISKPGQKLTR